MKKLFRQCIRVSGLILLLVAAAACSKKTPNYPAACSVSYHNYLRNLVQENNGDLTVIGSRQIVLLPTSSLFIGHSENLSANGAQLLHFISRSLTCHGRWVLSIRIYNAMFKSRRASKALAWQQGNVVMRKLWKNSQLSVAAATPKIGVKTCYKCQIGQSLVQIVTNG